MSIENIYEVNALYDYIVPDDMKNKYYNATKYPVVYGYNITTSYRNGGKTTNYLLWLMCANKLFNSHGSYIRTDKSMITQSKIMTLFDSINNYIFDDGKNYVQHIYDDKYNRVVYIPREKRFVLACETDTDVKNNPTLLYVHSVDENDKLRSGFADSKLDVIIYDEFMDKKITSNTLINFLHIVSTFFRSRYKSIIFMACNMSTGAPTILQQMGIYTKVLSQTTPYMLYTTEKNTRVAVEILEVSESFSNERNMMNDTFFGFDLDGIEIIRGSSICHETFRELPEGSDITSMGIKIYSCGFWIDVYMVTNPEWQNMIYFKQGAPSKHRGDDITLTDDCNYAFTHPYTYASIGRDFTACITMAKYFRRQDVCCENYMTYVCANSFYDFYKISEYI